MARSCRACRRTIVCVSRFGREAAWCLVVAFAIATGVACSTDNPAIYRPSLTKAERDKQELAFRFGESYLRGVRRQRDPEEALRWFEVAGAHGWSAIGDMYARGDGVPRDADRAASYYRRAAETGSPLPMYSLGCLHADNEVSAPDVVEGYTWLLIAKTIADATPACVQHYECVQWVRKDRPGCRARLQQILTPAQRSDADRRAAEWIAARPRSGLPNRAVVNNVELLSAQ